MPPTFQGTMCVSVVELDSIAVRMDCHTGQWHWGWGQDQRKALLKKFTENNQPEAPLSTQAIPSSLGCSLSLSQVTPQGQKIDSSTFIQQKCLALINVSSLSCKWLSRWKYYKTFGSSVNQELILGVMIFHYCIQKAEQMFSNRYLK